MGRKINIGSGPFPLSGFENVDMNPETATPPVIKGDALSYDYADAEIVYAGHVLEHMDPEEVKNFFRRVRSQAPAAQLIVTVPVLDRCDHPTVDFKLLQQIVSHHESYPNAPRGIAHRSWWRTRDLLDALSQAGYSEVVEWATCPYLVARVAWQICLKCTG